MIKTPFMWAGSKDRDYPKIKPYISDFKLYNEPFLGGGSVYFRLLVDRGMFKAHCSDINEDLIATYETIRDDPKGLIAGLPPVKDKAVFKEFMSASPNIDKDRAIRFLYLNRNRFFGMGGWMNADRYARGAIIDRISFLSPLMQSTTFSKSCWDCEFPEGSFTFCDPPYPDTNNSACYKIADQEIMNLNMNYLSVMAETGENFFWVTKFSNEMFSHVSCYDDLLVEKKEWIFRKPGKEPQVDYELYVSRKS